MTEYRFLRPLDVLYLRGNNLFEGAGAYGASLMPPWPTLAAGALRSRMLADAGADFSAFGRGDAHPGDWDLAGCLGTPSEPGSFRVTLFTLAKCSGDSVRPCMPLPADLIVTSKLLGEANYLRPIQLDPALRHSAASPFVPVLRSAGSGKPQKDLWLTAEGWGAYVQGRPIQRPHLLRQDGLWRNDPRLGIVLDSGTGSVQSGMLYSTETVALHHDVGFLVGITGADGHLPATGLVRLGGDGRGAAISRCQAQLPEVDWDAIDREGRYRLVLSTPGIFLDGWRPPGTDQENRWKGPEGITARLVASAVSRAEVVSGWDLADRRQKAEDRVASTGAVYSGQPKAAYRAAPTGSVYWLDQLRGGIDGLRKLAEQGFWAIDDYPNAQREAEGFNNVLIAAWPREDS